MRSRTLLVVVCATVGGLAWVAGAQTDLAERLDDLLRQGRYDLAQQMADDRAERGEALTPRAKWLRAQLETDADRFDRLALELANTTAPGVDPREVTLARAREQFARGRYQTAAELLGPLTAPGAPQGDGEALLWLGMAEQATGQPGAATRALKAIQPSMATYGMSRALLADLALRAGRTEEAAREARASLDADPDVGALALSVLERSARQQGDEDAATAFAERLRDEYPESAEAGWAREIRDPGVATGGGIPTQDVTDGRDGFAIQFGAFRDRSLALRLAERIEDTVDDVRIELDRSDGDALYRVVGGRFLTRAQAEARQRTLQGDGWQVMILTPARGGR